MLTESELRLGFARSLNELVFLKSTGRNKHTRRENTVTFSRTAIQLLSF